MADGTKFFGPYGACGEILGSASDIVVDLNFKPLNVYIYNRSQLTMAVWNRAMPADSIYYMNSAGNATFSTSAGITPGNKGFLLAGGSTINGAGHIIYWEADRSIN